MQGVKNGRSMWEEAREILRSSVRMIESEQDDLAELVRRRFTAFSRYRVDYSKTEEMRNPAGVGSSSCTR